LAWFVRYSAFVGSTSSVPNRKQTRYPASFEVHIETIIRRFVTRTRDVSSGGLFFFASSPPRVGHRLTLTVHTERGVALSLKGTVRYRIPEIGAGVEIDDAEDAEPFRKIVGDIGRASGAWNAINGFIRADQEEAAPDPSAFDDQELFEIGASCEAMRILFERFPPTDVPDDHHFKDKLSGISSEPVKLKLHAKDRLRDVRIGVLKGGGFAAIIAPADSGLPSLYALRGTESIVTSEGGRPVFPSFTTADLRRIAQDTTPPAVSPGTKRRHPTADLPAIPKLLVELSTWKRYDEKAEKALTQIFDGCEAETRVYEVHGQARPVRLMREMVLRVRAKAGEEQTGIPFDDGQRMCVIVGAKDRPMHIRPLTSDDEICVPLRDSH
jgi:hypothetical protein